MRTITNVPAVGLLEANEKLYTSLTYGISLEQDLGDGKKAATSASSTSSNPRTTSSWSPASTSCRAPRQDHPRPGAVCERHSTRRHRVQEPNARRKWKSDAIEQLLRYQEVGEEYRERGMPRLFETVQIVIATCGQAAHYGTVLTPPRFWSEWKSAYPRSESDLAAALGRTAVPQDTLLCGMLAPENLLDLVRNFVVFERDDKSGKTLKKLARYQQFGAVNKAIARARTAKRPRTAAASCGTPRVPARA